jgi:hypothetical protein
MNDTFFDPRRYPELTAIVDPRAVMVHFYNASIANAACGCDAMDGRRRGGNTKQKIGPESGGVREVRITI